MNNNLKEQIKSLASEQGMTLKDVANKAGLNYNNILNKFSRGTIYVKDLEKILSVLGMRITFKDK